jgi:iron complex transport system ATP-binding protein
MTAYDASRSRLVADGLRLAYRATVVVEELDLALPTGAVTAIVGPNGCGKSTLLRALGRLMTPTAGTVLLDGEDLHRLPTRQVARTIALLPQSPVAPAGITVHDLVTRGRHPHQTWLRQWSAHDMDVVAETLRTTGIADLAGRPVDQLSGGQRQRVWLAMVLAQQTEILLLDEPTTYLDLTHQVEVLDLVHRLNREQDRTVVMVLHDLNQAARYADHIVVMRDGAVFQQGRPDEVISSDLLRDAFQLQAAVITDPLTGGPLVVPVTHATQPLDPALPSPTLPKGQP